MEYVSTRDIEEEKWSFADVLLQGLAPDKGLYLPTEVPVIHDLQAYSTMPYHELFLNITSRFIGSSLSLAEQVAIVREAYSQANFPNGTTETITPVTKIADDIYVQDLSDGPTFAFKDQALQVVCRQMAKVLALRGQKLDILGATSGDTGSAAGDAVLASREYLSLFMLSPRDRGSRFQQAQMRIQSYPNSNVHHIQLPFDFDGCQEIVKQLKQREGFEDLGALNSINWARILAQITYYASGYFQAVRDGGRLGDPVDFVVPTGNFGNVLAGYYARQIGIPIRNLVIATNENNVLVDLVHNGVYDIPKESLQTTSPSMDIVVSSNFERLVYDLFDRNPASTKTYMDQVRPGNRLEFTEHGIAADALLRLGFRAAMSTSDDRLATIRAVHAETGGFLIDPHTADAVTVARCLSEQNDGVKMVCLATADPMKFEETMKSALGYIPERTDRRALDIESLSGAAGRFVMLQSIEEVAEYITNNRFVNT
ncbi:threonine synthase [Candidatus Saccharibacteria bacterium]|nr:threonine synthase [Candidatus Saccharibacteria bacterium]MCB9821456.1 threonine synthase [Candidatus Nomurabacteria bacterium]